MPLTGAEKMKRWRERLKQSEKYEEFKMKRRQKILEKKKQLQEELPSSAWENKQEEERNKTRERAQKYRFLKKLKDSGKYDEYSAKHWQEAKKDLEKAKTLQEKKEEESKKSRERVKKCRFIKKLKESGNYEEFDEENWQEVKNSLEKGKSLQEKKEEERMKTRERARKWRLLKKLKESKEYEQEKSKQSREENKDLQEGQCIFSKSSVHIKEENKEEEEELPSSSCEKKEQHVRMKASERVRKWRLLKKLKESGNYEAYRQEVQQSHEEKYQLREELPFSDWEKKKEEERNKTRERARKWRFLKKLKESGIFVDFDMKHWQEVKKSLEKKKSDTEKKEEERRKSCERVKKWRLLKKLKESGKYEEFMMKRQQEIKQKREEKRLRLLKKLEESVKCKELEIEHQQETEQSPEENENLPIQQEELFSFGKSPLHIKAEEEDEEQLLYVFEESCVHIKQEKNEQNRYKKSTKKKKFLNQQHTKVTTRSRAKKSKTTSGRFECDHCSKTFAWKKDLYRHERYHEPNTKKFPCPHCDRRFIRKDKLSSHLLVHTPKSAQYFAHNLYSEKKFQEIKCMLCDFSKASNVRELRRHISLHNNLELVTDLAHSEVVKKFYPTKDLTEAMSLIASQIEANQFGKLHSIVNANSYEMGISDSDDSDAEREPKYTCEVCKESFNRKHKLMQHQSYEHSFDECPYKCESCKLRFTCQKVLESHLKHHCENPERGLQCKKCPGRFTWLKNFENHTCDKAKGADKKSINCEACDKVFNSPRDLRLHKKNHIPCGEYHDCSICGEKNFRLESLRWHLKTHEKNDKLPLKKMLCMLCQAKFSSMRSLKLHLFTHSDGQTGVDLKNSGFISNFHPGADESTISERIRSCFSEQKLWQLYLAVNKYGDEMVLSDSDSEDEQQCRQSPSEPFICEVCGVKCSRMQAIHKHQSIEHDPEKISFPHKCNECGEQFICEALLRRHSKGGCLNANKVNACSKCGAKFIWKQNLDAHQKNHVPSGKSYSCSLCGEKFLRPDNLRWHLKMHSRRDKVQVKKMLCMLCQTEFSNIGSLKQHLFSHSDGQTDVNFKTCGFVSNFYPDADEATISDRIRSCFNEQKLWQLYLAVNKFGHEMVLSDSDSDDEQQQSKEGPSKTYICELCDVKFSRMQAIRQHQHFQHDSVKSIGSFPHKCTECGDEFVSEALLGRHTKSECSNSSRTNACSKCGTKFTWKQNLVAHICGVTSKDDKKCEVCGKKFIWLKDLQRHKRSHIPESKKFECLVCGKKFNRKDNMRQHMKVHQADDEVKTKPVLRWKQQDENLCRPHGEKTIQCKICSTKYTSIRELTSHLVTHKERFKLDESEVKELSMRFYRKQLGVGAFSKAICRDITEGKHARFYSIANEMGYELDVLDSETGSEFGTDADADDDDDAPKGYTCKLCNKSFNRKFKIFEHQRTDHSWDELPLECSHCSAKFACESLFNWHLKSQCEDGEKQHKCKWCPLKFMWKDNLRTHEKYTHDKYPTKKKFHCKTCDKSFLWFKDLSRHKKIHRLEDEKFECTWCFRVFMRRDNLKVHMKVHQNANHLSLPDIYYLARPNGTKVGECKHCDQKYSTAHELLNHIQGSHLKYQLPITAPNPSSYSITNALGYEMDIEDSETEREEPIEKYSCELCNAHFNRRFKLLKHQQALHYSDTIPHKCTQCNFKSVSKFVLGYHMRTQCMNALKKYRCSKCTMRFMWPENLENHESLIHDSPRTHSCEVCKRDFATQHDLKNHPDCKPPTEVKLFECELCDRKYNRKDRLMKHIKVHSTDVPKETRVKSAAPTDKFLCAFCGKAVSSSSNLVIHLRRHTGEKPFKCEFCNKGFPRSSDLSCHRRTHTGERPYKCTTCDKAFSRSYKLQTHMRIHSGERPYKCTYCEKSFTQSNDLTLHVRRHTGERPYICEICGERFIQGTALRNHRRIQGHYEM